MLICRRLRRLLVPAEALPLRRQLLRLHDAHPHATDLGTVQCIDGRPTTLLRRILGVATVLVRQKVYIDQVAEPAEHVAQYWNGQGLGKEKILFRVN